jgi:tight adherence protein B
MENLGSLTVGVTLLAGVLAVLGVHTYSVGKAQRQALVDRLSHTGQTAVPTGRRRRFSGIDRRLRGTRLGKKIQTKIDTTGLDLTPGEFSVHTLAGVAGLWFIVQTLFASFFGLIAAVLGLWGANSFLNWQRNKRTDKFINQLPELTRILANATQAGLALRTAIGMAADELEKPAGEELSLVTSRLAVGHSIDDALGELAERLPSRELTVLVTTLVLSNRAGGTVVSSLRNLTETLDERKETRREVRTQLSQVKVTGFVVPAMGLAALLLVDRVMPGALERMSAEFIGQSVIVAAFLLYGIGLFVLHRLSKIDV